MLSHSFPKLDLFYADHYIESFDYGISLFIFGKAEFFDCAIDDNGNELCATGQLDSNLRVNCAVDNFNHFTLQSIPGTDFHGLAPKV